MAKDRPRVAIGIPTWNRSGLLKLALESVRSQEGVELEVIVVDDASTDDTPAVLAAVDDPRVRVVRNEQNLGHVGTVNRLLGELLATDADAIGLLFDDDELFPGHLARVAGLLEQHPQAAVAHTAYELWTLDGERVPVVLPGATAVFEESGRHFVRAAMAAPPRVWVATALLRRTSAAGLAFSTADEPATDVIFWLRAATRGSVVYDPTPTACYRVTEGYSSEQGFLAIVGDRYVPTFATVTAYRRVFENFAREHPQPPLETARLRLASARSCHGLLQAVVRRRAPGLRPRQEATRLLREALRVDPTAAVDPLFWAKVALEARNRR